MTRARHHIAIIGGGTAGWLAALMLQKACKGPDAPQISVIESPNIPTVGVGEGSTSIFRQVLLDLGIHEDDFLRETGATFKFGIKHAGWRRDGRDYFGPIDDPNLLGPVPQGLPSNWLHHAQIAAGKNTADIHLFTHLMRRKTAPYALKQGKPIAVSPFHYAYHFDQARLGRFLAEKARQGDLGITHTLAEISAINRHPDTGDITALRCTDDRHIPVDFVIDCTGFRRAIIGQMSGGWLSYADILPLNKAMPFWLDHDPKTEIATYTLAQAMGAGWMWGIPVQDRMGCGYVFSDAHLTPDQAQLEIEARLKQPITVRSLIDINPGRQTQAWIGNCVAIGLSQSFLEPLEATSIHGSLVQLLLLLQNKIPDLTSGRYDTARSRYNQTVARQVDDFAQFLNLHYAGGRKDTTFWQEMTTCGITETTRNRLELWQHEPIMRSHFEGFPDALPHVEEQLYTPVLDGLGLLAAKPSKSVLSPTPETRAQARKTNERLKTEFKQAAQLAIGHRAYLETLS
ncbi:MAG: tryptophan 7-halogenase [Pelagimonas sp.]|jgi:tryptophan halogenase|nr:tryptophan 7-halogenase [Pelagimonas sp.]